MNKDDSIIAGLDIGTTKTAVCIGGIDELNRVNIYHLAVVKTRGIDRGVIVDLGQVAGCIEEAVRKAENTFLYSGWNKSNMKKENIKINSVYASISGEHIIGNNIKGMLNLSNQPVKITFQDSQRAIESAKSLVNSMEREILHALTQEFVIDGSKRIKNPLGIYGTRLGVNLHIIGCGLSFLNSLQKAINRAGIDIEEIIYSGLATSLAVITEAERQNGVILLELGGGTSNILFFNEDSLKYTSVIPVGGNDITKEISLRLNIDFGQAEQLKMRYRNMRGDYLSANRNNERIIIKKNSSVYESIPQQYLSEIIEEELVKMVSFIQKELELARIIPKANCGIVICGGMSFMDGIIEKLEEFIKLPVRIGVMRGFVSNLSGLNSVYYATGIGLIMHRLSRQRLNPQDSLSEKGVLGQIMNRIKNVYEEYF